MNHVFGVKASNITPASNGRPVGRYSKNVSFGDLVSDFLRTASNGGHRRFAVCHTWDNSLARSRTAAGREVEVGRRNGGIGLGGILVILGIVLIIVWSFWWGLIIGLVGLVFFGGFARGKWY
jgi:hypothetical protein